MMLVVIDKSRDKTFVDEMKEFKNDCMLVALETDLELGWTTRQLT